MSTHGSDDEFESSILDSPSGLNELLPNPFQSVIGDPFTLFTGRITRSRSSATPPLQIPNNEILTEVEPALQTTVAEVQSASAPTVQNLGLAGDTSSSRNISAEETETKLTIRDLTLVIDIVMSRLQQQPPPLVSQPQQQTGTASVPFTTLLAPSIILAVPKSEYQETTSAQSKLFFSLPKFSNSGKDNRDNMETFIVALGECDLLTLAKGQRVLPVITTRNPRGYSAEQLVMEDNGLYSYIPADDIHKRIHDIKRLMVILNMVTSKDLHYLVKRAIADNDAVLWFKSIYDHINGTKNTDIRKATDALNHLKLKATQTIQENVATIEEAFRVLTVASGIPITEDQKLYHLQEKLEHDTRVSVLSSMAFSKTSSESYEDTIKKLIILDPAPTVAHKVASLTTSAELCRRHIAGLCTNGAQCKYSHGPSPATKAIPPAGKAPNKTPPPPLKPDGKAGGVKPPFKPFKKPVVVSEDHRALIGYPRGKPSSTNPAGYSINQLTAIRTLQTSDTDGWANGDPEYFTGAGSVPSTERFNMVRAVRYPRDVGTMVSMYPLHYHISPSPLLTEIKRTIATITNSVTVYNRGMRDHVDLTQDNVTFAMTGIVAYLSNSPNGANPIKLFIGFGWLSVIAAITDSFRIRDDVRNGSKGLMRLLYKINKRFLNASIELPDKEDATDASYMTFNPSSNTYYHPGTDGHYESTMTSVERYFIAIEYIYQNVTHIPTADIMYLATLLDYASFVSLRFRDTISSGGTITRARQNIRHSLAQYEDSVTHAHHSQFHTAFKAIVDMAKAAPFPPDMQKMIPTPSAHTFNRMSAPRREDTLSDTTTQSPGGNDDDDEEWEDANTSDDDNESVAHGITVERQQYYADEAQKQLRLRQPSSFSSSSSRTSSSSNMELYPKKRKSVEKVRDPASPKKRTSFANQQAIDVTSPPPRSDTRSSIPVAASASSNQSSDIVESETSPAPSKSPARRTITQIRQSHSPRPSSSDMNLLTVNMPNHKIMSLKQDTERIIIDSGASTSGTGIKSKLLNVKPTSCSVTAAFGESLHPTESGLLPPLMLDTIVIDQMDATTLLSVSQACAKGLVAVFTSKNCKFFNAKDVIPHMQALSKNATPVITGTVEDGLYLMDSK